MQPPLTEYLDFARQVAFEAGRLTLGYFQAGVQADFKADDTPVTVADRRAEELIRAAIGKRYPTHRIVGEEFGAGAGSPGAPCWYIDPIDGTKSFIRGVPLYGVLLGLEMAGRVEVGVAYFPALDEMVSAASGLGCHLNGRRCRVLETESLARSIVSFTDAGSFEQYDRGREWQRIVEASWYRVGWSDAYGHALVASGRLELMLDPVVKPWDCGPFPVILREAGGYFGDWSGNETIHAGEAISTTARLLPEVLRVLTSE
jgi:myo-inositol-1(or 4)-monophosphatase